jgi:hypothetical protein
LSGFVAPLTASGVAAALTLNAAFHAVIDRRWIVQIIRVRGGHDRVDGPDPIGEALHYGAYLVSAVTAASVSTLAGWVVTAVLAVASVLAAAIIEHRRALTAANRIGHPYRL